MRKNTETESAATDSTQDTISARYEKTFWQKAVAVGRMPDGRYIVVSPQNNGSGMNVFVRFEKGQPIMDSEVFHAMRFVYAEMAKGIAEALGPEWRVAEIFPEQA